MPELASDGAVAARDALREALSKPLAGEELTRDEAVALLATPELTAELLATASALRDRARLWPPAPHHRGPPLARRDGTPEGSEREPRAHARERVAAAARPRPGAPVGARQGAGAPAAHAARGGGAPHPLHDGPPPRHRRDARRARRHALRHPRPAPRLRPRAGGDRAELPRQADHSPR